MHSEHNKPRRLWELFVTIGLLGMYFIFMWRALH